MDGGSVHAETAFKSAATEIPPLAREAAAQRIIPGTD
jgi:hypothetical protein